MRKQRYMIKGDGTRVPDNRASESDCKASTPASKIAALMRHHAERGRVQVIQAVRGMAAQLDGADGEISSEQDHRLNMVCLACKIPRHWLKPVQHAPIDISDTDQEQEGSSDSDSSSAGSSDCTPQRTASKHAPSTAAASDSDSTQSEGSDTGYSSCCSDSDYEPDEQVLVQATKKRRRPQKRPTKKIQQAIYDGESDNGGIKQYRNVQPRSKYTVPKVGMTIMFSCEILHAASKRRTRKWYQGRVKVHLGNNKYTIAWLTGESDDRFLIRSTYNTQPTAPVDRWFICKAR